MAISVVSVNIERKNHLDRVRDFLISENADIVCLMEVCEEDVIDLAGGRYPFTTYAPNDLQTRFGGGEGTLGVAILSKKPIENVERYYCGENIDKNLKEPGMGTHSPVLLAGETCGVRIGSVHFSWTSDGDADVRQKIHLQLLLKYLESRGEIVVTGDFNIPRGRELYFEIANKFKDNIPENILSTIDPELHRANKNDHGKLALVVDYVWTRHLAESRQGTPEYSVRDVRVISGVSDHCALAYSIDKI